jgi:outer membrane protein
MLKGKTRYRMMIGVMLCLSGMSGFQVAIAAESAFKIGMLDWQQLLAKAPQAAEAGKRLEKEFQARQESLTVKKKDFQTKQEKLQRDKDVMTEAERNKFDKEVTKLNHEIRHLTEELSADYTARHREEMDDFLKKVKDEVEKIATDEKYDLVLSQEAAVYMSERADITEKVLQRLTKIKGK